MKKEILRKDGDQPKRKRSKGILERSQKMITSFLLNNDVPAWYRGMSWFQTHAANEMQSAIRDDVQQDSVFRVEHVLTQIGLVPLPTKKLLKVIMRISRGNDLAFLWFLMEACYKTDGKTYDINEQLLMSMIAHLDMVTTLRELDRILPPPNPSQRDIDLKKAKELKAQKMQEREKRKQEKLKLKAASKDTEGLPYFRPLVRRKIRRSKLQCKMPNTKAGLDMYTSYRDPTYEVPNEATRWFATYNLNPASRFATKMIRHEIDQLFEDENNILLQEVTRRMMHSHVRSALGDVSKEPPASMCTTHIMEREAQSLKERERLVKKRAECLKFIDVDLYKREKRQKRILEQLEKDVKTYSIKNAEVKKKEMGKSHVVVLHDDYLSDRMVSDTDPKYCQRHAMKHACDARHVLELTKMCTLGLRLAGGQQLPENETEGVNDGAGDQTRSEQETSEVTHDADHEQSDSETDRPEYEPDGVTMCRLAKRLEGGQDRSPAKADEAKHETARQLWCPARMAILAKDGARTDSVIKHAKDDRPLNFEHAEAVTTPSTSEMFFLKPTDNKPYQFNYPQIFNFKNGDKDVQQLRNALLAQLGGAKPGAKKTKDGLPDIKEAAQNCAQKDFEKKVEPFEEDVKKRDCGPREIFDGVPKRDFYNCNDRVLLNKMLMEALKKMAKEPRFVLASMPDAHKLPVLREWIYRRFGKKYTQEDLTKLGKTSIQVFTALRQIPFYVRLPRVTEMGENMHVSYNCREYLIKKSAMLKKQFYARYDAAIMNLAREFWFAMCPHLYPKSPPKTTFFSYMPPHTLAINHFRPWKSDEYMNAKAVWDRKMRIVLMKKQ